MCNLNIIAKIPSLLKKDKDLNSFVTFLCASTANSYLTNNDADGMYMNGKLDKGDRKINPLDFGIEEIRKSKFILTHQRLATHGKEELYAQPFMNNELDKFLTEETETPPTNHS